MVVIIFGVAGSGKTTIGELLASDLGWCFYDADDFHSQSNREKMRRGVALTDQDRQPWLARLRELIERCLAANENAVLACSALKRKYRDPLRVNAQVNFVFLHGDFALIAERLKQRPGHFFDPALLQSQYADLEGPQPDEGVATIEVNHQPHELVAEIKARLRLP
ncbi:MAG: gluconokinase [Chthoniobacterales bacterium]